MAFGSRITIARVNKGIAFVGRSVQSYPSTLKCRNDYPPKIIEKLRSTK